MLAEDNEGDAFLTRECFKKASHPIVLHHVTDGEECLAFLRKEGTYATAPTPDLILLDINMPKMNGHQVMDRVLADQRLCHLTVVVLTTSSNEDDINQMLCRRCNSYVVKPMDLDDFQKAINGLCDYWFNLPGLVPPPR